MTATATVHARATVVLSAGWLVAFWVVTVRSEGDRRTWTTAAAFPIGRSTVLNLDQRTSLDQPTSNPSKQHKNDNDNQDDADNADTTSP
jgi:hypothetical protein